jgi:homoserine dehydrogenase
VAPDAVRGEYYLRFMVVDRPGVLGRIAGILGQHEVSIASVIQREREHGRVVPVVIRTHDVGEQALRRAVRAIDRLAVVRGRSTVIRIEESLS